MYSRMARGKSPASAPTGVDTQHICWLLSSGRDGICEMQQRLTGCGTLSCRSCGIGREMTHCGASIRELTRGGEIDLCAFQSFEGKQWLGFGHWTWRGGNGDLVWEGRRQPGVHGDGTREDSCQYPTTDPWLEHIVPHKIRVDPGRVWHHMVLCGME